MTHDLREFGNQGQGRKASGIAGGSSAHGSRTHGRRAEGLRPGAPPRGISLLEVLISIFVLSVGLLGIAAIIPVGRSQIVQTQIADRSSACAWAAQREIYVREMLRPTRWLGLNPANPTGFQAVIAGGMLPPAESFCIDPYYIALKQEQGTNLAGLHRFPYLLPYYGAPITMQRITLGLCSAPEFSAHRALFERIFVSQDDLIIEIPDDRALRPRQMFQCATGESVPFPKRVGDSSAAQWTLALSRQAQGEYSWMAALTPQACEALHTPANQRTYELSIIVFRNRNLLAPQDDANQAKPSERLAVANLMGGPDVRLSIAAVGSLNPSECLAVRENEWLLLCGQVAYGVASGGASLVRGVFKWYRVVAAGEIRQGAGGRWFRDVTLAGPDWNPTWSLSTTDTDGDGVVLETQAVLVDNVVGVYTQTVEPDRLAPWTNPLF